MKYKDFVKLYREKVLYCVPADKCKDPARLRLEFDNMLDDAHKGGHITDKQVFEWVPPKRVLTVRGWVKL